ncbi:hypothetical protein IAT38_002498 [Cryptococcus sp. DSM 104549]
MATFTLPPAFPIVGIPLAAVFALTSYQSMSVMSARKAAGVKYPNCYASAAEAEADPKKMKFNCAQRAHANTLENLPQTLALFGFLSLYHPKVASAALLVWCYARLAYTQGYATGDPSKRISITYQIGYLGLATIVFGAFGVAIQKSIPLFF